MPSHKTNNDESNFSPKSNAQPMMSMVPSDNESPERTKKIHYFKNH